jgi:hypothetical protein
MFDGLHECGNEVSSSCAPSAASPLTRPARGKQQAWRALAWRWRPLCHGHVPFPCRPSCWQLPPVPALGGLRMQPAGISWTLAFHCAADSKLGGRPGA